MSVTGTVEIRFRLHACSSHTWILRTAGAGDCLGISPYQAEDLIQFFSRSFLSDLRASSEAGGENNVFSILLIEQGGR